MSNEPKKMKGIILAGGQGNKMFPFNAKWQKACLPIGNEPNIVRIVKQLQRFGIDEIVVLTDYLKKQVAHVLRDCENVDICHTASHAINHDLVEVASGRDVLVYYGDMYVSDRDLNDLLLKYRDQGTTMMLEKKGNKFRVSDYIAAVEMGGIIENIYGHPREHYAEARVCGVYALEANLMKYIKHCPETFLNVPVGGMPPAEFYLEQCLMEAVKDQRIINAVYASQGAVDLDFPWDILFANEKYCLERVGPLSENRIGLNVTISEQARIYGKIMIGDNSTIGDNVIIKGNCIIGSNTAIENGVIIEENCVIGDNCTVTDYCKISANTVIGNHNKIGFTAEVAGVTFDRVSIVHHSQVYGVIGKGTDIAAGCQTGNLRFDDLENPNRVGDKTYSNKFTSAVFVGDHTRTGVGNIFFPGVKIGANCALGPGALLQQDIPHNKMALVNQDLNLKEWGSSRYGW